MLKNKAFFIAGAASSEGGGGEEPSIESGTLYATGSNSDGLLGTGDNNNIDEFAQIGASSDWVITSSGWFHTIGLRGNGDIYTWGQNDEGATGLGTTSGDQLTPAQVNDISNVDYIEAGGRSSYIIIGGTLYATGLNSDGQLGLGDTDPRDEFEQVGEFVDWEQVAAGSTHVLAIRNGGLLYAWGANQNGRTGLNTASNDTLSPTQVGSGEDWISISTVDNHCLGIRGVGELYAWGSNSEGKTGLDTTSGDTLVPTQVGSFDDWVMAAAGGRHSLALRSNGDLYAWGRNDEGQLGLGDNVDRDEPTFVDTIANVKAIVAGYDHTIVLLENGELYVCGLNTTGQLGLDDTSNRYTLTLVSAFDDVINIGRIINASTFAIRGV